VRSKIRHSARSFSGKSFSLPVGTDADQLLTLKLHRMPKGPLDLQHHHRLSVHRHLEETKLDLGRQQTQQPVLQLLVAHLRRSRRESRADDRMAAAVLYTPDQVGERLAGQRRRIRQCRNVLPNLLRIDVVDLELSPLRLVR
jgi:hypothetical protein